MFCVCVCVCFLVRITLRWTSVHKYIWLFALTSRCIPRSRIAASHSGSAVNFWEVSRTLFYKDYTSFSLPGKGEWELRFLCILCSLFCSFFLILPPLSLPSSYSFPNQPNVKRWSDTLVWTCLAFPRCLLISNTSPYVYWSCLHFWRNDCLSLLKLAFWLGFLFCYC